MADDLALIGRCLFVLAAVLVLLSAGQQLLVSWRLLSEPLMLFDAGRERSAINWLSVALSFACAVVLALIARCEQDLRSSRWGYWLVLALGLAVMSVEEQSGSIVRLATESAEPVRVLGRRLEWPPIVAAAAALLVFAGFIRRLPSGPRAGFLVAGGLYVAGVIGIDVLVRSFPGDQDRIMGGVVTTAEEAFEIAGLLVLLFAVTRYWLQLLQVRRDSDRGAASGGG